MTSDEEIFCFYINKLYKLLNVNKLSDKKLEIQFKDLNKLHYVQICIILFDYFEKVEIKMADSKIDVADFKKRMKKDVLKYNMQRFNDILKILKLQLQTKEITFTVLELKQKMDECSKDGKKIKRRYSF
jgi:hypothetical protein